MKKLVIGLTLLLSTSALATGGFYCSTKSGDVSVSGVIGAGGTLSTTVQVSIDSNKVAVNTTMGYVDYSNQEIKIASYDVMENVNRLSLKVENGKGRLSLELPEVSIDNEKVKCEME